MNFTKHLKHMDGTDIIFGKGESAGPKTFAKFAQEMLLLKRGATDASEHQARYELAQKIQENAADLTLTVEEKQMLCDSMCNTTTMLAGQVAIEINLGE